MSQTKYALFLKMTDILKQMSTCCRRQVGCILLDSRNKVLATGYNGTASGTAHCTTSPCPGAKLPSGVGLDLCEAIHAEQNALLQCADVNKIAVCVVTCSPCIHCMKLLMNTGCHTIVCKEIYDIAAIKLFKSAHVDNEVLFIEI